MRPRYALGTLLFTAAVLIGSAPAFAQGDTCTTALQVVSGVFNSTGPTSGSAGPSCGSGNNGNWYLYTATFNGTITISSCHPLNNGTSFDTYLKVYTGNCDQLVCVGFNDDMGQASQSCPNNPFASFMQVNVTAGQNYYIVWTNTFSSLPFTWELSACAGTAVGVTYRDLNSNGAREAGEMHAPVMLLVQPGDHYVYSGNDPYSFCTELGTHTVTVPTLPQYHTAAPTSRSFTIAAQGDQATGVDFAFQPIPGMYDAAVSLWGWNPWIGNNTQLHIHYSNPGTEPIDASALLTLDPLLSYVSASIPATSVNGQLVTWDLGTLQPGASGTINVTVFTSISATPNAPTMCSVVLATEQSDIAPANNTDDVHGFATTSFDPNDKAVDLVSITPDQAAAQQKLEYTIRFQNTGTAPAVNVVIKDSLDADWDLATFEMLGATHSFTLTIDNEVAIWTFANIMLPDSATDPLGSQGSFSYRMAARSSLQLGEQLTNRADIYFDYNEPVLTNTTVTTVELSTGLTDAQRTGALDLFPNPSNGLVELRHHGAPLTNARLQVLDALGRVAYTSTVNGLSQGRSVALDLGGLPSGTYVAHLTADGVEERVRFVIRH